MAKGGFTSAKILVCLFAASTAMRAQAGVPDKSAPVTPTEGSALPKSWSLTKAEVKDLPNGNHAASLLEFMFQPAVLANTDTGGFARAENVQISMLGESYKWQRWYFGGANISNPGKPGEPLLYLPIGILDSLMAEKYLSANTEKNGIHLNPLKVSEATNSVQFSMPIPLGGPSFIPRAAADREPASDWGAPTTARGFAAGSFEGNALISLGGKDQRTGFLFADGYLARRNFNNLGTPETAGEGTVLAGLNPSWLPNDSLHFALQARSRTNLGAEYFFKESQTLKSGQYSLLAQYNFSSPKAEGALAWGYAYRQTDLNSNALTRSVTDTPYQAPAFLPDNVHTMFIDGSGFKKIPWDLIPIEYGINSRVEFEHRRQRPPADQLTETLNNSALAATLYDGASSEANYLMRWQPFLRAVKKSARSEFSAGVNGHIDWGFTDAGTKLGFVHPAGNLRGQTYLGGSNFFLGGGVLHDTLGFTLQEVSYLNSDSLSGKRYNWADANGNGVVDTGELSQGTQTGGKYHRIGGNLQAPQKEELNLNFGYTGWQHWLLQLNFNGRIYRKLFEVRYADGSSPAFTSSTAGGSVAVYNKTGTGSELYELRNSDKDAYYAHIEITIAKAPSSGDWIFRGSIGGYYGAGYSPQGLNAFYNDTGAYNEGTADPNFRETRFGRLDNDRGYLGKIIFGRRFAKVFTVSNVLRYRDGQAMAGYQVVTGLAQGPILVPTEERGGGLSGVGRHTYSLAWDLRLRYDAVLFGNTAWAFLDIYNLLNSRTELAEYVMVGTAYRDPVEQGIQRTMRLGLGMNF